MIGKNVRMKSLINPRTGRTVIVAMDHGQIIGPAHGLENPLEAFRRVVKGKPDAILTTRGMVERGWEALDPAIGLMIRITGGFTVLGGKFEEALISSVSHALKLGATGVAVTVKYGHEREDEFTRQASLVADDCYDWGMPLMTEVWPAGKNVDKPSNLSAVKLGARAAAEFGTDIVKTFYPGSEEGCAEVVAGCPVPVVVLGGEKVDAPIETFQMVESAMKAGAAGVAMGRNVWGQPDPTRMIEALRGIVHEGWSAEQADSYCGRQG
ncbi:MAG: 2-amino-3,7-dideoxy-D-threo-hept-6-ulosonate synthase [Clostridia bacterium]|nr:2-amino-3,7-dideoxy-D-threo-hept-6-ulosonate synthase [Clostridia bacterium]